MNVIFVRHGETLGTKRRAYCGGGCDEPLCDSEANRLCSLRPFFQPHFAFTSGMVRCDQTAALLFPHAERKPVPALREMDFGAFEGKAFADLSDDPAYRAWVDSGCESACPNGESRASFSQRVVKAFRCAMKGCGASSAEPVVFVVHAGTIRALLAELGEPPLPYFCVNTQPGNAWSCRWDGSRLHVVRSDVPVSEATCACLGGEK